LRILPFPSCKLPLLQPNLQKDSQSSFSAPQTTLEANKQKNITVKNTFVVFIIDGPPSSLKPEQGRLTFILFFREDKMLRTTPMFSIKGLDEKSPLSFISSDLSGVATYARVSNRAYRIMNKQLPGPFTFILQAMKEVNRYMLHKRKHIGIRVPQSNICRMITQELGNPIITTSVPLWREKVLNSGEVIDDFFGKQIDLVLDIGIMVSEPSTIVDCTTDDFQIVRQGKGHLEL